MDAFKGIIFDYGGTIDSRGDHWSHILWQGWRQAGVEATEEEFRHAYVETERLFAREKIVVCSDTFADLMQKKALWELRYLQKDAGKDYVKYAPLVAEYCYLYARQCVDEARPVLEALHERYPMVLVSNFYGNIEAVLADMGIRQLFQGIIESAVVGVRKPDARIFAMGCLSLDLPASDVLVVGDSLRKDILPARSLGCKTAWIKGRGWTAGEDAAADAAQIPSLRALLGT